MNCDICFWMIGEWCLKRPTGNSCSLRPCMHGTHNHHHRGPGRTRSAQLVCLGPEVLCPFRHAKHAIHVHHRVTLVFARSGVQSLSASNSAGKRAWGNYSKTAIRRLAASVWRWWLWALTGLHIWAVAEEQRSQAGSWSRMAHGVRGVVFRPGAFQCHQIRLPRKAG